MGNKTLQESQFWNTSSWHEKWKSDIYEDLVTNHAFAGTATKPHGPLTVG